MSYTVNWEDRDEAYEAIQKQYPHMKPFLIDIVYNIYKESLTDDELDKKIRELEWEPKTRPSILDYPEIDYKTEGAVTILKKGEYPTWECEYCGRCDETFRSKEDNKFCDGCVEHFKKEKKNNISNNIDHEV